MTDATVKPTTLALLRDVRQLEREMVASLTDAERAATGTAEHHLLAPKHMVSHITAARRRQEERLAALARGETPPADHHTPEQVFAAHEHDPWPEVEEEAEAVSTALVARLEALDERVLAQRFPWTHGEPLVAQILVNGVWHPYGHVADFYRARGDQERVARMHAGLIRTMGTMDEWAVLRDDPRSLYNLACFNALGGATDKALALITDAVQRDPELIESARQDSDLDSLRRDPAFERLMASGAAS